MRRTAGASATTAAVVRHSDGKQLASSFWDLYQPLDDRMKQQMVHAVFKTVVLGALREDRALTTIRGLLS